MKRFLLFLIFLHVAQLATAQTTTITGTVKDTQGDPLHFAFVQNNQKQGVYTDSLGNFSINITTGASLQINCTGYRDTTFAVNDKSNLQIVLNFAGPAKGTEASAVSGDASGQTMQNTFKDDVNLSSQFDAGTGAILPTFNPKEETQGSRYIIKGWAHGFVITVKDVTVQNSGFVYNYDKIGGSLLLSKDKRSAIEINRDIVKSFTLYDNSNNAFMFANVPAIDNIHYAEVLYDGNKYKIYKAIKTTFEKENFSTDGLYSTGHNYDLYIDEYTYYVYNVKTSALQKITLKKKAIKEAFATDADKLNRFMSDHSSDSIDDMYLAELGSSLNE